MRSLKREIGEALLAKIKESHDILKIAKWAEELYFYSRRDFPDEINKILQSLLGMSEGPEFEFSLDELQAWARNLIDQGEVEEAKLRASSADLKGLEPFSKQFIVEELLYLISWHDVDKIIRWSKEMNIKFGDKFTPELHDIISALSSMQPGSEFSKQDIKTLAEELIREGKQEMINLDQSRNI